MLSLIYHFNIHTYSYCILFIIYNYTVLDNGIIYSEVHLSFTYFYQMKQVKDLCLKQNTKISLHPFVINDHVSFEFDTYVPYLFVVYTDIM